MFGDGKKQNQIWPDSSLFHTYADTGWFRVHLIPQLQEGICIDTAHHLIFATQVKADFDLDESNFPQVKLFNKSANAVRYEWSFGQESAGSSNYSTEKDPIHTYKADTGSSFQICLRAYASNDCYDSLCKNTTPKVLLVIPNVFTPNNDNKNDAFDINMMGGNFYELYIYNRWGELVYESEKDGIGNDGINWNGNNHQTGEPCAEGVYYYIFNYRLITQPSVRNSRGSITLIRD
jgi:gliding motility-associated-like protein